MPRGDQVLYRPAIGVLMALWGRECHIINGFPFDIMVLIRHLRLYDDRMSRDRGMAGRLRLLAGRP